MSNLGVQYSQKPIRLQLSTASNPPVPPVDANTGAAPRFWRGYPVAVQVGIFDAQGNPVDLANLSQLSLVLMASPLSPVSVATVSTSSITSGISSEDWANGIDQNATFLLTAANTDQSLDGGTSAQYWLVVLGLTTDSPPQPIAYGAGWVTIYNPGNSLPYSTPGFVSNHESAINGSSTFTVTPGSQMHTERVSVGNIAGSSQCVVTADGLDAGAHVWLRFNLPALPGTEIDIFDQSLTGSNLFKVYSDPSGYTPAALYHIEFDGTNFQRMESVVPANGQQS